MNEISIENRLTVVEERSKSNTHQIADLKPFVTEIHTMSKTMVLLVEQVKNTNENVDELRADVKGNIDTIKGDVQEIKTRPFKRWSQNKQLFIGGVIGCAASAAFGIAKALFESFF